VITFFHHCGRYPVKWIVELMKDVAPAFHALANLFSCRGHWTLAFLTHWPKHHPYVGKPGWNLTTAMAAAAIAWLNQLNAIAPDKPFFCYYVPGGTHAPHHPTTEWIEKFKGKFDMGWNALYQRAFTSIGLPIRGVTTQFPTLASIQVSWTPSWPA
jgi:Sulfatase